MRLITVVFRQNFCAAFASVIFNGAHFTGFLENEFIEEDGKDGSYEGE